MKFNPGSGTAVLKDNLAHGVSIWKGPFNLKDDGDLQISIRAMRDKGVYEGTLKDPKNDWATMHEFKFKAFGGSNKQEANVKGLGKVVFYRGTTRDDDPCIRMQVIAMRAPQRAF